MGKRLIIIALIVVAILAAGLYVVFFSSDDTSAPTSNTNSTEAEPSTDSVSSENSSVASTTGEYKDYTESSIDNTEGTKLLFFHAPWCPQCRALDASIKESDLPADTTIFKVDYDSNQALRQKYGVTIQTTVVKVDDRGDKTDSYVAYDEPTFTAVESALLP